MIITIIVIDLIFMIMINDRHLQVGGRQLFSISESQLDVCGRPSIHSHYSTVQ